MSDQSLWGTLVILYIIPAGIYFVWHQSEDSVSDIRKELYPGRTEVIEDKNKHESRFIKFLIGWCIGFGVLLVGYKAAWNPIGTGILILGAPLTVLALYSGVRYLNLLTNRYFRLWLAGSVVWILAVWSWYVVFGSHSELNGEEFALLALMPTLVTAAGIVAWRWARKS